MEVMKQQPLHSAKAFVEEEAQYVASFSRIPYYDLVIDEARGSRLKDLDGNTYLDLITSASAINVGHTHPKVVQAIQDQAKKLIHYTPAYYYNGPAKELAKKLVEITPGSFSKRVAYGLSGSDANDGIIKLARAYTGRPYIIAFKNSYHGSTFGSLSLSAISLNMRRKFGSHLPDIIHVPYPEVYHSDSNDEATVVRECLKALEDVFSTFASPDEVAAVLIEPIAGDAGIVVPPKVFMKELYRLCQKHGILFSVDEVQQGMGRTGKWWAIENFDIEPDLMSIAKSLGSGMPISAIVGRAEIMDSLQAPAHLFTTGGNPVCCASALATIEVIEEEDLLTQSREKGNYVAERFRQMQEAFDFIGDVRGIGLNLGIEIVESQANRLPDKDAGLKIIYRAFEKGVAIITIAQSVLRFQPALTMSYAELEEALDVLYNVFCELRDGKISNDIYCSGTGW